MEIKKFDRQNLRSIRTQIDAALNKIAADNGLKSLKIGAMSFQDTTFTARLTAEAVGDAQSQQIDNARLDALFGLYKLPAELKTETFEFKGETYKFDKINTRKSTYPIGCINQADGKSYGFTVEHIKQIFALKSLQKKDKTV